MKRIIFLSVPAAIALLSPLPGHAVGIPTFKAPPAAPKSVTAPKVPVVKVPVASKITAVRVPVVKTPSLPKAPAVRVPAVKIQATPKTVKLPTTPKIPVAKVPPAPKALSLPKTTTASPVLKRPIKPAVTLLREGPKPDLNPGRRNPSPGSRQVVEGNSPKPNGKGKGTTTSTPPPASSSDGTLTTGGDSGTTATSGAGIITASEGSGSSSKP